MRHIPFHSTLYSPKGVVSHKEQDLYTIVFENIPKGFLGFENPIEHFLLNPTLSYRLMGAYLRLHDLQTEPNKQKITVIASSNIPISIGKKIGSLFVCDPRFLVRDENFIEQLKEENLLSLSNAPQKVGDRLQLTLHPESEHYLLPDLLLKEHDFNESILTTLLEKHTSGEILRLKPIQHETLFLVSDICLSAKGNYTPLLHRNNSTDFEIYTEPPYRQKIHFFSPRSIQKTVCCSSKITEIFATMPSEEFRSALFLCAPSQAPFTHDWISLPSSKIQLPAVIRKESDHLLLDTFIQEQCETPILEALQSKEIDSQGVLFVTYFPSFFLRSYFLDQKVRKKIKQIYFLNPSKKTPGFFSHADRSFLLDLNAYGIEIFWLDRSSNQLLLFSERVCNYTGLFLPPARLHEYEQALTIGIYGSSHVTTNIEHDLRTILSGLKTVVTQPLAVSTGGGPGVMGIANRVAHELNILSIAHLCNFSFEPMNPYLDGKMTYRIEKMIERQAEFLVKLPIFFLGGFGSDLELALEIVGRQVGSYECTPILLFGSADYWEQKITSRFLLNQKSGTLRGTEYLSNTLIQVETGEEAVQVYRRYFSQQLLLGPKGRVYPRGFCLFKEI